MPNLSIKDVPDELAEALRQQAARNHRSLQGELMAIIQQAARPTTTQTSQQGGWRRGTLTIEEIAEQIRARNREPVRGVPLAVDIIREDRDSR